MFRAIGIGHKCMLVSMTEHTSKGTRIVIDKVG
jgi:hypothetical protein